MKITVRYWIGTTQYTGTATTYRGAIRIASRNQNRCLPTYWDQNGFQLYDDGIGLCRLEPGEPETDHTGPRCYAV
jgi:hypothetical protein